MTNNSERLDDGWSVHPVRDGWLIIERVGYQITSFGPYKTLADLESKLEERRQPHGS